MHLSTIHINHSAFPTTEHYPFNLAPIQNTENLRFKKPITCLIGDNGSGKSTLLRAICKACRIHIWEGREHTPFEYNQYESSLPQVLKAEWFDEAVQGSFFSPELFRNYSQLVDEWAVTSPGILKYYGGASLVTQSHGQSSMSYFRSIYEKKGLYFLDEPEAALSPKSELALLSLLEELSHQGHAQFVVATHSPVLMSSELATLYSFDGDKIEEIDYQDTDHFKVYKSFFDKY